MLLSFPEQIAGEPADGVAIRHRSSSMPILAAALFAGVEISQAYEYAHAYLAWATQPVATRMQNHQLSVENLEALCVEVGPVPAMQFHQELHRAFIDGRVRQSAFK